jgi:hypothetical protein
MNKKQILSKLEAEAKTGTDIFYAVRDAEYNLIYPQGVREQKWVSLTKAKSIVDESDIEETYQDTE